MTDGNRSVGRLATLGSALIILVLIWAPSAHGAEEFGLESTDIQFTDAAGNPYTQAGGNPAAISTQIVLRHHLDTDPGDPVALLESEKGAGQVPDGGTPKDIGGELAPGIIDNPTAVPQCTQTQLAGGGGSLSIGSAENPSCPPDSQVGQIRLLTHLTNSILSTDYFSLYNMMPGLDEPAAFGFQVMGTPIRLSAAVRSDGDYGVTISDHDIQSAFRLWGAELTVWGVPADPSHDPRRCTAAEFNFHGICPAPHASELVPRAFLRMPTRCTAPGEGLPFAAIADNWFDPGNFSRLTTFSHEPPNYPEAPGPQLGTAGCEEVPFEPGFSVTPTTRQANAPTGLNLQLTMPQEGINKPGGISQSDLRAAEIALPEGMTVNPSSAGGLDGCSSQQIGLLTPIGQTPIHFTNAEPSCPSSSKVGQVEIVSPLLEEPMLGSVYLAAQEDNPFGSLLALYVYAKGHNVIVKLPVLVKADPGTGRLTTVVEELPQFPFESVQISLKSGQRAPLINPPACGRQTATAVLTPWSGNPPVTESSSFQLTNNANGLPCVSGEGGAPFSPRFGEGSSNPEAGVTSTFVVHLARSDGEQRFGLLSAELPKGISAHLAGVPYCPDSALAAGRVAALSGRAEQSSPSCPAASQVGTVLAATGAGTIPFQASGKAYLAGPYEGAPISFAVFVPAVAGPFDLGDVLVRVPAHVDPETAQVTISNRFPSILRGIPLDVRTVDVVIDRPGFVQNPTSCDPTAPKATVTSTLGKSASAEPHYQLLDCQKLGFSPKLSIHLSGATDRRGFPALHATMKAKAGQANIGLVSVNLPHSEFLAQNHLDHICTRVQFNATGVPGEGCPAGSSYGFARAFSPLFAAPLEGPVYLRSDPERELPDLVAALRGQVNIVLVGHIDSHNQGLRTTFEGVPDAPVSKFTLSMKGQKKGLLENSQNLCAHKQRAAVQIDGQNGKTADAAVPITNGCKGAKKKHAKKRH